MTNAEIYSNLEQSISSNKRSLYTAHKLAEQISHVENRSKITQKLRLIYEDIDKLQQDLKAMG